MRKKLREDLEELREIIERSCIRTLPGYRIKELIGETLTVVGISRSGAVKKYEEREEKNVSGFVVNNQKINWVIDGSLFYETGKIHIRANYFDVDVDSRNIITLSLREPVK